MFPTLIWEPSDPEPIYATSRVYILGFEVPAEYTWHAVWNFSVDGPILLAGNTSLNPKLLPEDEDYPSASSSYRY